MEPKRIVGTTFAGMAVLAGEAYYAARRRLPSFEGLDPSGTFGDPDLPELEIVVLGDSTVTGPGVQNPDDLFVRRIARYLSDQHHVRLRSYAVGGARSSEVLRTQVPLALEHSPHLTFISVGGNDVLRAVPVPVFERNLEAIVAAMKVVSGAVVLMGVGDIGTVPRVPPPLTKIVSLSGRIADRVHARVAERNGAWKADHWGWSAQAFREPAMFSPDLFHPSPAGHLVWAETVYPVVQEALASLATRPG